MVRLVCILVAALVGLAFVACGEGSPKPLTSTTLLQPTTIGSATDSASPSPAPSPSPKPSPSRTKASPSPSPSSCPADNAVRSWYYLPNDRHQVPAVAADAKRLLGAYGGHYVGDTGEKVVYLTFDEGYENGLTTQILDELEEAEVSAAFFVTGSYVRTNPELVRRMVAGGHVVANHTDTHPSLPSLAFQTAAFANELTATAEAFRKVTGKELVRLLRPPMGEYSARSLCLTRRLGYETVFWSFAHRDWLVDDQPPVALTLRRLLAGRHNGAIYLLHAVSSSDTKALPRFITELQSLGYRFAPLTELSQ